MSKIIRISNDSYKRLEDIKYAHRLRSMNEALEAVIQVCSDDLAARKAADEFDPHESKPQNENKNGR